MSQRAVSERSLIALIGAVQFVNILDFVMVMPLAPYFATALGIASADNGIVAGSYTAAASIAGLAGGYFLDRFDRRKALAVSMLGLVLSTAAAGLATGLYSMIVARVCAGLFGGPATSLALSIIADIIPGERRGKAMGAVMAAFSVAQVVGQPLSLKAATLGGWRAPFLGVAAMGLVVVIVAIFFLPPVRGHLEKEARQAHPVGVWELLGRRDVQLSYLMSAFVMMSGFIIIPHIPAYVVHNLGFPLEDLWKLYLVGGIASFITVRLTGPRVDRYGAFRTGTVGALLGVVLTYVGFVDYPLWLSMYALFIGFMVAMGIRNVSYNTLTSRVPENAVRARFMSLQSAISHMASALASGVFSRKLLETLPDQSLVGMEHVAEVSIVLALCVPVMLFIVERGVRAKAAAAKAMAASASGGAVALAPSSSASRH